MTGGPAKPSMRAALGPAFAARGDAALIARRRRLVLGPAGMRSRRPLNPAALDAVRVALERDPDASARMICAAVRLRRQDVLDALRSLRPFAESADPVAAPGNRFPGRQGRRDEPEAST